MTMDKRYIKLGNDLVEIVCMDSASQIFAPLNSPSFKGTVLVQFTDSDSDLSAVNIKYLNSVISQLNSKISELEERISQLESK